MSIEISIKYLFASKTELLHLTCFDLEQLEQVKYKFFLEFSQYS